MLRSKEQLNEYLLDKCSKLAFETDKTKKICDIMKDNHGVSIGSTMDMLIREKISDQNEMTLFWLLNAIDQVEKTSVVKEFYTSHEIKTYPKKKIEKVKPIDSLVIDCFQVNDDQWITVKDVDFFMGLRRHSKIRYNENAQRVLKKVVKNGKEIFKLAINRAAVKAIKLLMENNLYIPNTITLNINPEFDADVTFEDGKLVIKNLDMFDISDGYHRYLAMCEVKDSNPNFNFNMELRITNFPDEKACQFIWQEDQKTKMRRVDSESMNTNSFANSIVDFLIVNKTFYLKGNDNINKNAGKINFGELAVVIKYFNKNAKNMNRKEISDLSKDIADKWNNLIDACPSLLDKEHISFKELCLMFYIMNTYKEDEYNKYVSSAFNNIDLLSNKKFMSKVITKNIEEDITSYMKEVEKNV